MVDKDEGKSFPPEDIAQFFFSRKPVMGRHTLKISYRDIQVGITWPDTTEGGLNLDRLMGSMNGIMESAKAEMDIVHQFADMDSELDKLLGGDGE
jgi:hypothetical protein